MSKFIYIINRNIDDNCKLLSFTESMKLLFKTDDKFYSATSDTAYIFVSKPAHNTVVSSKMDYFVNSQFNTDDNLFIKIIHLADSLQISNDLVGSRVMWYYLDENCFIVSSSQIAIVTYIKSFEPNPTAWTWMLSNGSLGPGFSWDKRIKALDAGATLSFYKIHWKVKIKLLKWSFNYNLDNKPNNKEILSNLLESIIPDFDLNNNKTLLTLSGGYDSRAALFLLKGKNPNIHSATWGVPNAFKMQKTDASIARKISKIWNIYHQEFNVELQKDFLSVLDNFLYNGEGRNDHINSFMDGLHMWKSIEEQGYKFVVRADEAFGWLPVRSELDARTSVALARLSDFNNVPKSLIDALPTQIFPENLLRNDNELIEDYRDRLYHQYRLPFVIGPLQDLPLSFVEILNPLLHPKLISYVRTLPPHLRTKKRIYADWVDNLLPSIPYASVPAIPEAFNIAQAPENEKIFLELFHDSSTQNMFGNELMVFLKNNWRVKITENKGVPSLWKSQIKSIIPVRLKKLIRNKVTGYSLNTSSLALRTLIIYRMQHIMKDAAK